MPMRPLPLLAALLATAPAAAAAAGACDGPEFRQFDFWVGDWEVFGTDGKLAGVNQITREYGGCVIHEHYSTSRGYAGESLNIYDAGRKVWHQSWVDSSGTLLLLDGGLQGRDMVLEGNLTDARGAVTRQRITWTPNADGTVRQLWQAADAKGEWTVLFDGTYRRAAK
jgi:hypothetical protein